MDWIERQPTAVRPAWYGAFLILIATGAKAGPLGIVVIGVLLWRSADPLQTLASITGLIVFVMAAGALAGASYGLWGRPLLRRGGLSAHVGGFLTVLPYMLAGGALLLKSAPKGVRLEDIGLMLGSAVVCSVFFGSAVVTTLYARWRAD